MKLRELTEAELDMLYRGELTRAFPQTERRPLSSIRKLRGQGCYDVLGAVLETEIAGYAFLWRGNDDTLALLDYLGVVEGLRGQGLGTELLSLVCGRYIPHMPLLAEVEAPQAQTEPERHVQRRRLEFYRRSGFSYAGFDARLFGVHYRMLKGGTGEANFLREGYERLYRSQLPGPLYRKFVQTTRMDAGIGGMEV